METDTEIGISARREAWAAVLSSRAFRWLGPRFFPPFHRFLNRVSGGRTLLDSRRSPMLVLHSTGARSGAARDTPLGVVPLSDGRLVVVGSNFAQESHPAWTANLLAHPDAEITFRGRRRPVQARLVVGDERRELWPELLARYPVWNHYTEKTGREFRVFELTEPDQVGR